MGMYNWTDPTGVRPRPYASAVRYFCPRKDWGYSSDGLNERVVFCQMDGTWSNDVDIEPCVSK